MRVNNISCVQEYTTLTQNVCRVKGLVVWNNHIKQLEVKRGTEENKLPNFFTFLASDGVLLHGNESARSVIWRRNGIEITKDKDREFALWSVRIK
jgi:hypothetical protein